LTHFGLGRFWRQCWQRVARTRDRRVRTLAVRASPPV